jgi:hypothetical protein
MNNEKGASLVVVLITIFVVFIFGLSLASMSLSARLQINNTEKQNVATDLAEMGISYFNQRIDQVVLTANETVKQLTLTKLNNNELNLAGVEAFYSKEFCVEVEKNILIEKSKISPVQIDEKRSFEISFKTDPNVQIDCQRASNELQVKFSSKGTDDTHTKTLEGVKYIVKSLVQIDDGNGDSRLPVSSLEPPDANTYISIFIDDKNDFKNDNDSRIVNHNARVINEFHLSGKEELYLNKNVIFNGPFKLSGQSTVTINGDAYFHEEIDVKGNGDICIKGFPWLIKDGTITYYHIPGNTCSPPPPPKYKETDIKIIWSSTDRDIDVSY